MADFIADFKITTSPIFLAAEKYRKGILTFQIP
jgi:hypothetical protein